MTDIKHGSKPPVAGCIAILAVTAGIALLSHEPVLVLACGSVVAVAIGLLWRMGEAPVLLMAAGLQLGQVIVMPLYAGVTGVPVQDVWFHVGDVIMAIWFALAALLSLVVGMWCGHLGARSTASHMRLEAMAWSPRAAFFFCVATVLLSVSFISLGGVYDGLRQPMLAASRVEWAGVFVLTYVCTAQRRGLAYVLIISFFEVLRGFMGFFGDFKEIFVVLLVAVLAASPRLNPRTVLTGLVLTGIVVTLGVFWSTIKSDYRRYLSQGSSEQVVLVPLEDRANYLMDRASEIDAETMQWGFHALLKRWSYVDLLSATMRNVPGRVPFENGALVSATVLHVIQPRLLFPDKPPLPSDTEIAVRYSGIRFDQGGNAATTSISVGYVAELYVDFGIVGALVAMFILGLVAGRAVRYLAASTTLPAVLNSGLAVMLMMSVASFEQALAKMIGAAVTTIVVVLLLRSLLLPYLLSMWGPATAVKIGAELPHGAGRMGA